ncbi:aminotransferase [Streptomyces sp. WAC 01529]|uniref:aminotransferase class I/II-fold pyridoxal phosphate-dependent enzyme n=1 Tax=Streptomyces sp. WAC 01529 TaxID=2203205 RepID=UPI000F71F342|nr:aminotransferase class I/II-fold pyridoxal phosphate-dependent enzyme [Streptomyces sp. WAC 01529]AZM56547.1 aminotransferase [Streptomyces sp. WAC 01529]
MTERPAEPSTRPPLSLGEFETRARARVRPEVWDFIEGGAGEERTLTANRQAFTRARLRTRVLTGAAESRLATTVLGRRWAAPLAVAPMAYHTLVHAEGEIATARAAGSAGLPFVVSTFAGQTFEDIARAAESPLWLQVYCFRDRGTTRRLIERAKRAGFEALVLTADTPRLGRRPRDLRNGFRLPPGVVPANLPADGGDYTSPSDHSRTAMDPALDWSVVDWLRSVGGLPVLVKGVMTAEDAVLAVEAGADGIIVSNHGGRQLDGAQATLDVLAEVTAAAAGRCAVLLDGGVRRGTDVLTALALGADAVLLGRPVLHGLAVAGQEGVAQVLNLVTEELAEAMALTGTATVDAADVSLLTGPASPVTAAPVPAPVTRTLAPQPASGPRSSGATTLRREVLHGSLSDPVLDTMNFLNEITGRFPDAVSFAPGRPYEGFFDTEEVFGHIRRFVDHLTAGGSTADDIRTALHQYGPTAGIIRELIAESLHTDEAIETDPASIVVTVGAQEGMLLVLRALFRDPQDVLLVSSPCYVGITGAARLLGLTLRAVEEGEGGVDCAALEAVITAEKRAGRRPRVFYLVPDHSNPSGSTMSRQAREELLELAARHDLLILEDSPYRLISPGCRQPTLKSLDRERRVVHLGSYSKTVFPGARVGFVVADQAVVDDKGSGLLADELAKLKSMVTVNTPALSQAVVAGALLASGGSLAAHNEVSAKHYGDTLRCVLDQLDRQFTAAGLRERGVSWNRPSGGFFLTVRVPFDADDTALLHSAREFGVIWTPMSYFYPAAGGERTIRLSFSSLSHEEIEKGIGRLAAFLLARTKRSTDARQPTGRDAS